VTGEPVLLGVTPSQATTKPIAADDATTTPFVRPTIDAVPSATDDDASDGVVRAIQGADTARLTHARSRPSVPEHDGPPVKETTGEIREKPRKDPEPIVEETSIVIADLAAAHNAIAAAASHLREATPPDAASASRELAVSDVRRDAVVAFTAAEEAFFDTAEQAPSNAETFADLDEDYQPQGFWDRLLGRKPKK